MALSARSNKEEKILAYSYARYAIGISSGSDAPLVIFIIVKKPTFCDLYVYIDFTVINWVYLFRA